MKGFSPVITVCLLILIGMALVLILNQWARDTVVKILTESTGTYYNSTKTVVGTFFNLFRR